MEELISRLADATIGDTFNFYRDGDGAEIRRSRLLTYLCARENAPLLLVGEAAGYRGARVSGIPFTSERQLTGTGPAEASATTVHRVLAELGIEEDVLLWNVVPTHPGTGTSNRRPTKAEVEAGLPYVQELACGRLTISVGRLAHAALGEPYVRHPSHGGARAFRAGIRCCLGEAEGPGLERPGPSSAAAGSRFTDRSP
jgi:uracil-DNA glycosylase